jgi:hypothetical protein
MADMRIGGDQIGRRGWAVLAAAGIGGVLLAAHGWSARGAGLAPGSLAGGQATAGASAGQTGQHRTGNGGPAQSGPAAPSGTPRTSTAPAAGQATPRSRGPLLSSQPYASFAFQVWPGPPSQAARLALTGLRVSVHDTGTGILVSAGIAGQPLPAGRLYPAGTRVYIVESSLGDDSSSTDYNLGDDGLVVTDGHGRIVQ